MNKTKKAAKIEIEATLKEMEDLVKKGKKGKKIEEKFESLLDQNDEAFIAYEKGDAKECRFWYIVFLVLWAIFSIGNIIFLFTDNKPLSTLFTNLMWASLVSLTFFGAQKNESELRVTIHQLAMALRKRTTALFLAKKTLDQVKEELEDLKATAEKVAKNGKTASKKS